ncbi:uncharacterized protein LOC131604490 [Vicia villosa]|uniref:uncharacterized protein LOC131604490 n=1 Tax=Vicia villosa TaxID=3911 RepID=UPI00273CBF91|nr:uncharacterized protein LOC131604490 [Vicia villosa]
MSVLVNGSPTREFSVTRGLRKGDPLSPFLFLLVAEGFEEMVKVASSLGDFKGFSLDDHNHFELLQFADDTILIGENSWNNLCTFKVILRGFELVSDLRVNLNKSRLFGVNLDPYFIQVGSSFLNCAIGSSSFVFLGIPVGINPRRCGVWRPLVSKLRRRIRSWHNRQLLISGRVVLLNSILSSIPIFYFSFYKVPESTILEIISIQRSFLWGGQEDKKKISWISWDKVCLPKKGSGLGVKHCGKFNLELLRTMPLGILFPDLLSMSDAPHSKVADMSRWNGENWIWALGIFCDSEDRASAKQLNNLVILLAPVQPCRLLEDSFVWWINPSGFTVSNAYDTIMLFELPIPPLENSFSSLFSQLWKTKVPNRIHLFGWRLIWSILLTKSELAKRGILIVPHLLVCPLCRRVDEDLDHLFLHCHIVRIWWKKLSIWLGLDDASLAETILKRLSLLESSCKSSFRL